MKRSKRYRAAKAMIESGQTYNLDDAVTLLKKITGSEETKVKFDEPLEISFNLNLKAKHTVRDTLTFAHSLQKSEVRILVFARGDAAEAAKNSGAMYVGDDELIDKVKGGWVDFDVAIATPDMMKGVGKLGPVLGRRGLMPNPKTGTVTNDVEKTINEFQKGKTEFRANKQGIINLRIGRSSFSEEQIIENVKMLYSEIIKKKPTDLKGAYIKSCHLSPCMGPGVPIVHQTIA